MTTPSLKLLDLPISGISQSEVFQAIIDCSAGLLYAKDTQHRFIFANRALALYFGFSDPSDLLGKTDVELFLGVYADQFASDERELFRTGIPIIEQIEPRGDTEVPDQWILTTKIPIRSSSGEIVGLVGSALDISERYQTEAAFALERDLLRRLMDSLPDMVFFKDTESRFVRINRSGAAVLGIANPEEAIGKSDKDFVPAEIAERFVADDQQIMLTKTPLVQQIERITGSDGNEHWVSTTKAPTFDAEGNVIGVIGVSRDVSALVKAEENLRLRDRAINAATNAIMIMDASLPGRPFLDVNAAFERMTGYRADEVIGTDGLVMFGSETDEVRVSELMRALDEEREGSATLLLYRKGGDSFSADVHVSPVRDESDQVTHVVAVFTDVTERERAQEELRFQGELLDQATASVVATDLDGNITHWNRYSKVMYGWAQDEAIGMQTDTVTIGPVSTEIAQAIRERLSAGHAWQGEYEARCKNGLLICVQAYNTPVLDSGGNVVGVVSVSIDVGERKTLEEQLGRMAFTDSLTGLPNRAHFLLKLQAALDLGLAPAVVFLDLDGFKLINDSLGHGTGDLLLKQVARRLRIGLRPDDILARFGGDEFAILIKESLSDGETAQIANRLLASFQSPFDLDNRETFIGASAGIAFAQVSSGRAEELLRDADVALYEAKRHGRNQVALFTSEVGARATGRLQLETELRQGLLLEQFELYYQPIVDLNSGSVHGFEALIRWHHPERGLLLPGEFIELAEETGLIVGLGEWVLAEACRQGGIWNTDRPDIRTIIAINVSPRQFRGTSLGHALWRELGKANMPPDRLKLEVTEQALVDDDESVPRFLGSVKALGVRLALDDFGIGYSSLGRLHALPLDVVKIDRSFIQGLGVDPYAAAIVRAITTLGHELGLTVTAEGIETTEQLRIVKELGCDFGQGFLFARPAPVAQAEELLRSGLQEMIRTVA